MSAETSPAIGKLVVWLRSLGARLVDCEIRDSSDGVRGVYACSPLDRDTRLMEIPARCLLTALSSEALTIALLTASKPAASFWRPYLDTLPVSFPSMPLFFGPRDRELLKGSCTLPMIDHQKRTFAAEYRRLRTACHGTSPFTYREYLWGRAMVLTRGMSLRVRGAPVKTLVPMVDMLNHCVPPETNWGVDERTGDFRVTTNRQVAADGQVHCSYGVSFNSRLLVNYGFALAGNPHDEAQVAIPSISAPRRVELLLNELWACGGGEPGYFRLTRDVASAEPLLAYLRVACADAGEPLRVAGTRVEPLGCRQEVRVLTALRWACLDALAAFSGTLTEDDALLSRTDLTVNERNAAIVRRGEKQVLQQYVELADSVLPVLRLPPAQVSRLALSPPSSLSIFAAYFRTLQAISLRP